MKTLDLHENKHPNVRTCTAIAIIVKKRWNGDQQKL